MSHSLEDVKKVIKSILTTNLQNGLSCLALNSEFMETEGFAIPWRTFGASSLNEFLKSLTDTLHPGTNKAGDAVFFARVDSSTAHIANFVTNQKPQPIKRRNGNHRNDEKRPCREPSPAPVPHAQAVSAPSVSSRSRRNGSAHENGDRRREPIRAERQRWFNREPSPMSISPPPPRTPSPKPDRLRNPSPPRRTNSFRDASPDRSNRKQSSRDVNLSPLQNSPNSDYDREMAEAIRKRGLRPRTRRSRSPSPRRYRPRPSPPPPSPPRRRSPPKQMKTASCQVNTIPIPEKPIFKKLVSVSCQTDIPEPEKAKPVPAQQQSHQHEVAVGGDGTEDLNAAYYGVSSYGTPYGAPYANYQIPLANCPFNPYSSNLIPDPSVEEDKSRPGFYYDFDSGTLKPIPHIPEWYAYQVWMGWTPSVTAQPMNYQQHYQAQSNQAYNHHEPTMQAPSNPNQVNSLPEPPTRVIPTTPTTSPNVKALTRDPRLARQQAASAAATANNNSTVKTNGIDKQSPPAAPPKRKALSINDYMKARKLGPDKPQYILNEETQETPETLINSHEHLAKLGPKRATVGSK